MSTLYRWLKSLLFLLPAETAHNFALDAISLGLVRAPFESRPTTAMGIAFPNPIGLAAGFDKDARAAESWQNLGFGFAELGTVTRYPQPGNSKPRLWRLPDQQGLINRMGFNNSGADEMALRLENVTSRIPLGINLGKSKVTPLEDAAYDYAYSFEVLHRFARYCVINVSSPNTPGLRTLQEGELLAQIFELIKNIDDSVPLLVKIAPDLNDFQLEDVVRTASEYNLAGIIATNTTIDRSMLRHDPGYQGGLSGAPLREKAQHIRRRLRALMPAEMTLVASGGIMTPQDAVQAILDGCQLVQIYSGWVYGGPSLPAQMVRQLNESCPSSG